MAGTEHGNVTNEEFMEEAARYECVCNRKGGFPLSRKFYVDYARAFDWLYVRK